MATAATYTVRDLMDALRRFKDSDLVLVGEHRDTYSFRLERFDGPGDLEAVVLVRDRRVDLDELARQGQDSGGRRGGW